MSNVTAETQDVFTKLSAYNSHEHIYSFLLPDSILKVDDKFYLRTAIELFEYTEERRQEQLEKSIRDLCGDNTMFLLRARGGDLTAITFSDLCKAASEALAVERGEPSQNLDEAGFMFMLPDREVMLYLGIDARRGYLARENLRKHWLEKTLEKKNLQTALDAFRDTLHTMRARRIVPKIIDFSVGSKLLRGRFLEDTRKIFLKFGCKARYLYSIPRKKLPEDSIDDMTGRIRSFQSNLLGVDISGSMNEDSDTTQLNREKITERLRKIGDELFKGDRPVHFKIHAFEAHSGDDHPFYDSLWDFLTTIPPEVVGRLLVVFGHIAFLSDTAIEKMVSIHQEYGINFALDCNIQSNIHLQNRSKLRLLHTLTKVTHRQCALVRFGSDGQGILTQHGWQIDVKRELTKWMRCWLLFNDSEENSAEMANACMSSNAAQTVRRLGYELGSAPSEAETN